MFVYLKFFCCKCLKTMISLPQSTRWKVGQKLDTMCKMKKLNLIIDQIGLLRSSGRLLFAPTEIKIQNLKDRIAGIYFEHAHTICAHQATNSVEAFAHQSYYTFSSDCKSTPNNKNQCFCVAVSTLFGHSLDLLFWKQTKQNRERLWTFFYMPRCLTTTFENISRIEYRHPPQCISRVHPAEDTNLFSCTAIMEKYLSAPLKSWRNRLKL